MADGMLPPVVIDIVVNDAAATAQLKGFKDVVASTGTSVTSSTGRMSKDLEGIGAGAATGAARAEHSMVEAGAGVGRATKDVESKTSGFSSRVGKVFQSLGNVMGSFGLPFGNSVKKMGTSINEGEAANKGFGA